MSVFKIILISVLFLFFGIAPTHAQSAAKTDSAKTVKIQPKPFIDHWVGPDKGLHLLGSMMVTIVTVKTLQQNMNVKKRNGKKWAVGFTLSLGVGKELWDSTKPNDIFSWKDLCADVAGIFLGGIILDLE